MIPITEILDRISGLIEQLHDKPFTFALLLCLVKAVVEAVEDIYKGMDNTSGIDKKASAEDAVEYIYRKLGVDIPKVPNWLEIWLVRSMTGILIDWMVNTYNEKGFFSHSESTIQKAA